MAHKNKFKTSLVVYEEEQKIIYWFHLPYLGVIWRS